MDLIAVSNTGQYSGWNGELLEFHNCVSSLTGLALTTGDASLSF